MSSWDILDAPEVQDGQLQFSRSVIIRAFLAFTLMFCGFFGYAKVSGFEGLPTFKLLFFSFDSDALLLLMIIAFGLYFFIASLDFEAGDWYRIMVVSVSLIFAALVVSVAMLYFSRILESPLETFKVITFIALVAGGGTSIAVQFLRRKRYAYFVIVMVMTILFFSFVQSI